MGRQIVNVTKYYQSETANFLSQRSQHKRRKGKRRTQEVWNRFKDSAAMIYAVWETNFDLGDCDELGASLLPLARNRNRFKALFCRYNEIVRILSTVGYVYKTVEVEAVPFDPVILDPFPPDVLEAIDKYKPGDDNY